MRSSGVRSKERQRVVGKNQCKGTQITLPKILQYDSGFKIVYFTSISCTFGIMLSQFAAVECNVLIQAGRGSLSRLCFLQHKGKLEQMLIPHLRNKGNGYKLSAQWFLGTFG